jgi:hypothetical protein
MHLPRPEQFFDEEVTIGQETQVRFVSNFLKYPSAQLSHVGPPIPSSAGKQEHFPLPSTPSSHVPKFGLQLHFFLHSEPK